MATSVDGITLEELQLAARNHALPLEALRYPITPVGLHYLLIHFDIPAVDAQTWRLEVGGRVARPLSLSLDELKERPSRTLTVTMECAGNGRALYEPRALSQPWLLEAVGTAEWTGTPLASDPRAGGARRRRRRDRLHRLRPRRPGRCRARVRAEPPPGRGAARRGAARLRDQRAAAAAAARLPAAPARAVVVRHDARQVAALDHRRWTSRSGAGSRTSPIASASPRTSRARR